MWSEISYWLGFVMLGLLPGWALLRVCGVGWSLGEKLAAAPGISLGAAALAAYLAELVDLPVEPIAVLVVLGGLAALLYALRRRLSGSAPARTVVRRKDLWPAALVALGALAAFLLLSTLRSQVILPPSVDDGVHHATWTRLIYERTTLSPRAIHAPPLGAVAPVYYPWGFHGWLALVAKVTSGELIESYWRSVLLVGGCLPLSVYSLARVVLPERWPAVAASLLSVGFYWLPFQPYLWGGLPLVAGAVIALPLAALTIDAAAERNHAGGALAALVGLGLALVHPSQALGYLWITFVLGLAHWRYRSLSWRAPALLGGIMALIAAVLIVGAGHSAMVADFMARAENVGIEKAASGRPLSYWLADLYLLRGKTVPALGMLCGVGIIACLAHRPLRMVLWLHAGLLWLLPLALSRTWLTALWYHEFERLWYLQVAAVPLLAAAGMWGLVAIGRKVPGSKLGAVRRPEVMWPVGLALVAGSSYGFARAVPERFGRARATMASNPSHLDDFAWIREHVARHDLILNAPGDWGLVLPFTGRWITFPNCQLEQRPKKNWWAFSMVHNAGGFDEHHHQRLWSMGVRYVYAGLYPEFAVTTRPGPRLNTEALRWNPALEQVYQSATARIYRVRERLRHMDATEVPVGEHSPASFNGFYRVQRDGFGRAVRWTSGYGTVLIPRGLVPAGRACYLLLALRRPLHLPVTVVWDGAALPAEAPGVYPLPGRTHLLEIRSPTFVPSQVEDNSTDHRALGVAVKGLEIRCRPESTVPLGQGMSELPLTDGNGVSFEGFFPIERLAGSSWRWTNGRGRVSIRGELLPPGGDCYVFPVYLREPQPETIVLWDGSVPEAAGAEPPLSSPQAAQHRLEIKSPTHREVGGTQTRGVGLTRIRVHCPQADDEG